MQFQNKLFYSEICLIVPAITSTNNTIRNRLFQTRTKKHFHILVITTTNIFSTIKHNTVHHQFNVWLCKTVKNIVTNTVPYYSSSLVLTGQNADYNYTNVTALAKRYILLVSRIIMFYILCLTYIYSNVSSCSLLVDILIAFLATRALTITILAS